jgi:hypothetical protein
MVTSPVSQRFDARCLAGAIRQRPIGAGQDALTASPVPIVILVFKHLKGCVRSAPSGLIPADAFYLAFAELKRKKKD